MAAEQKTLDEDSGPLGAARLRPESRVGTVLAGKYHIDRVIGVGGMAVVYGVTHRNSKQFAIKLLRPEFSGYGEIRRRFLKEGRAANILKHSGTVAALDDDVTEDGCPFLVMELLDGEALDALLKRGGAVPVQFVLAIGQQLLDVLAAAHAVSIVHRDVKPANLFLTRDGTLKVLDFGIARFREALAPEHAQSTLMGSFLGTPRFMAPEQALGQSDEIDGRTDVWSAGATLFTLLTAAYVHEGKSSAEVLFKAASTQARSLVSVAPDVPGLVADLVDRALALEMSARWQSAEAMRDAIVQAHVSLYGRSPSRESLATLHHRRSGPRVPTLQLLGPTSVMPPSPVETVTLPISNHSPAQSQRVARGNETTRNAGGSKRVVVGALLLFISVAGAWTAYRWRGGAPTAVAAPSPAVSPPDAIRPGPQSSSASVAIPSGSTGAGTLDVLASIPSPPPSLRPSPPRSRPVPPPGSPRHAPCAFVTRIDSNNETHISCPCATCQ